MMKRLTSKSTIFQKRVLPIVFGGVSGSMALLISSQMIVVPNYLAVLIGILIGFAAWRLAASEVAVYMDEVIDNGDAIVVRNNGIEESVSLSDICEVKATYMRPAGVWVHFRCDTAFGRKVKFLPASSLFGFGKLVKSLNSRIAQLERMGVHTDW